MGGAGVAVCGWGDNDLVAALVGLLFGIGGLVVCSAVLGGFDVLGGALYEDVLAVEDAVGSVGAFKDDFGVGVEEEVGEDAVRAGLLRTLTPPFSLSVRVKCAMVEPSGRTNVSSTRLPLTRTSLPSGVGPSVGEFADGVGVHGRALEGDEAEVEERAEQHYGCDDEFQVQQADFLMCCG